MTRSIFLAVPVLLTASCAFAAAPVAPTQQVEIRAPGATEQRRNDTAGRISINRDDIARYGDVNVSSLLKRQPGISVVNNEVRMRGLGAGYTQILIDGEPTPPGFTIDSLAPSTIERIDIMRHGSAEFGAQAIAGTINIIMRRNHSKPQRDLTLGASAARGYLENPTLSLRWADQSGNLAWSLGLDVSRPGARYDESGFETEYKPQGEVLNDRIIRTTGAINNLRFTLLPRLTWKLGGGNSLAWQANIERGKMENRGCSSEIVIAGESTDYPDNCYDIEGVLRGLRTDVTWTHTIGPGKLVAKAAVTHTSRRSDYLFAGSGSMATLARRVLAEADDDTMSLSGKYLAPVGHGHSLALGWDGGRSDRREVRNERDTTLAGAPLGALNEDYEATVYRMALFAQDEWAITPRLQAYLGLRWEGLHTDVEGPTMDRVRNKSSVFSPVAQLLWKVPGSDKDQVRLALSRTYKAPPTRLLVPRRYTVNNGNTPTNPDTRGNPALRPELAWGLDAGYEKYFSNNGMASVSAYVRRIADVTVYEVDPDILPWLSAPSNKGNAKVAGIEADVKVTPRPSLDLRANLGYNWSELDAIPGPDNRLGDQVRVTSNLGVDYRATAALTFGASLNLQFAGAQRISAAQSAYTGPRRNLELYGLWKASEKSKWRLSASDTLQQDWDTRQAYASKTGEYRREFVETDRVIIRLTLETRL